MFVTVAGEEGADLLASTLGDLRTAFKNNGDPLVHCEVDGYRKTTFHLGLRIKCDAGYDGKQVKAAVEAALRGAFSFDARDFGQMVSRSEVITVAQEVEGVLGVDLDTFYSDPGARDYTSLAPAAATVEGGNAMAAGLLLLDDGPLDSLELVP